MIPLRVRRRRSASGSPRTIGQRTHRAREAVEHSLDHHPHTVTCCNFVTGPRFATTLVMSRYPEHDPRNARPDFFRRGGRGWFERIAHRVRSWAYGDKPRYQDRDERGRFIGDDEGVSGFER
jgi:hypothetical protein